MVRNTRKGSALALIAVLLALLSVAAEKSLYERLGGRERIRPMVDNAVEMVIANPRLRLNSSARQILNSAKAKDLQTLLFQVVCDETGGPCKSGNAGGALVRLLQAMELTPSDWDAMAAEFSAAMMKFKVGSREQSDLRALIDQVKAKAVTATPGHGG